MVLPVLQCARRDLNPHSLAATWPSTMRVYHSATHARETCRCGATPRWSMLIRCSEGLQKRHEKTVGAERLELSAFRA